MTFGRKNIGILLAWATFSLVSESYAQCTTCPMDCGAGCTTTISTSSSTNQTLSAGQKLCITGGTFTGSVSFSGDASVCVSGGNFNPSSLSASLSRTGTIQIGAGATATIPAVS